MINAVELGRNKERIVSFLRMRGPSLPVLIAREVKMEPLFVSAFLSELKNERKLKISNMKVGSSPLYFLEGQEGMLENFSEHLNSREREAFDLLRQEKVLPDAAQEPVVRVALRALKDFAIPVKIRIDGELKLFWKYFGLEDSEVGKFVKVRRRVSPQVSVPPASVQDAPQEIKRKESSPEIPVLPPEVKKEVVAEKKIERKPRVKEESEFVKNVKDYLRGREIEVLEVLGEKKKEFEARVRVDGVFGKQEYLLIAKDKKNVSDGDLARAVQKAQASRILGLVMSPGELNKGGREHLKDWGGLVKWEKLKI